MRLVSRIYTKPFRLHLRFATTIATLFLIGACNSVAPRPTLEDLEQSFAVSDLMVSDSPSRSGARDLNGATLSGNQYIFVRSRHGLIRVNFYLNDPQKRNGPRTANSAPYDFNGTHQNGSAQVLNTRNLKEGRNEMLAVLHLRNGQFRGIRAAFTVRNTGSNSSGGGRPGSANSVINARYGPVSNPSTSGRTVRVRTGDNLQNLVQRNPGNTTFVLDSGTHRITTPVSPKAGNTFVGRPGAIINGARLLTSFSREGNYWVATNQRQQGNRVGMCASGRPMCTHPEQLFINNQRLEQVARLSDVRAGRFYFDYGANKIYFQDNPNGKRVETSVAIGVFRHRIHDVTVRNLIVEKFANPAQHAALAATGDRWVIENNEARYNHGSGIGTNNQARIRGNYAHRNGQSGINGQGNGGIIEQNRLAHNNVAGFNTEWDTGGAKFVRTQNLVLRRNYVHDNNGYGLWCDINCTNTVFEENVVIGNLTGILLELSNGGAIRGNTLEKNNRRAGIIVSDTANVDVVGNYVNDNRNGIFVRSHGRREIRNVRVRNNTVIQLQANSRDWLVGIAAGLIVPHNVSRSTYTSNNNRFEGNTYVLSPAANFYWMHNTRTRAQWQSYGQDRSGHFSNR